MNSRERKQQQQKEEDSKNTSHFSSLAQEQHDPTNHMNPHPRQAQVHRPKPSASIQPARESTAGYPPAVQRYQHNCPEGQRATDNRTEDQQFQFHQYSNDLSPKLGQPQLIQKNQHQGRSPKYQLLFGAHLRHQTSKKKEYPQKQPIAHERSESIDD
jgi:hypothetical protein